MRFSGRTAWNREESGLAEAIRTRRLAGERLIDLTVSNPTVCGFDYDSVGILAALANSAAMLYDPDPQGLRVARKAVSAYYADHEAQVDAENLILTTSTSEAYSFLFRLLCDAGDSVLVARPSYPLFDFLADLEDVRLESYPLFEDFGWWIDLAELERRIRPATRAIVVVHPNNPTGHRTSRNEREQLEEVCVRHGLALIVDEVFLDYGLTGPVESFAAGDHPCLTFVVSGLSKIVALPQMKVGWIAGFGPETARQEAMERLEIVADTFLSLNAPAQLALPAWLAGRNSIQQQICDRVRGNVELLACGRGNLVPVDAGWSAVFRVPQRLGSERLAESLVQEAGVIVHPGWFYGLAGSHTLVLSLLGRRESFAEGVDRLNNWIEPDSLTFTARPSSALCRDSS